MSKCREQIIGHFHPRSRRVYVCDAQRVHFDWSKKVRTTVRMTGKRTPQGTLWIPVSLVGPVSNFPGCTVQRWSGMSTVITPTVIFLYFVPHLFPVLQIKLQNTLRGLFTVVAECYAEKSQPRAFNSHNSLNCVWKRVPFRIMEKTYTFSELKKNCFKKKGTSREDSLGL